MSQDGDAWTLEMREVHDVPGMIARFFCALVGVVCITLGVSWIATNRDLVQHGVRTTGVVVANHRYVFKGKVGDDVSYYPQVRYVGPGGQTYEVQGEGRSQPQRVGEKGTVYYDPRDPETALVYGADTDSMGWVFIGAGCVFFVLVPPWPLLWRLLRGTPTTQTSHRRQPAPTHTRTSNIRPRQNLPARRSSTKTRVRTQHKSTTRSRRNAPAGRRA